MIDQTVWYVLGGTWLLFGLWRLRFLLNGVRKLPLPSRAFVFLFYIFGALTGPMVDMQLQIESLIGTRTIIKKPRFSGFLKHLLNNLTGMTLLLIFLSILQGMVENEFGWFGPAVLAATGAAIALSLLQTFRETRKSKREKSSIH